MSDANQHDFQLDRYPWRELFGETVIAQLTALCDAARDIAAMRSRDRLRRLREAHEREAAVSTGNVLTLLMTRLDHQARRFDDQTPPFRNGTSTE